MRKCVLAAVVLLLGVTAIQARPPAGGSGPYERLDPKKLTETLRSLQMTELLGEVVGQQPATASAAAGGDLALAEEKVRLADKANNPAERDRLLKEALDLYRKIGQDTPKNEKDRWDRVFEARLRLIDAARVMAEPVAIRLMYLQGAEEDRKTVVASTDEAVKVLRDLKTAVDDRLMNYRQDSDKSNYVVYLRKATEVKARMDGVGAYLRLYRGMALPGDSTPGEVLLNYGMDMPPGSLLGKALLNWGRAHLAAVLERKTLLNQLISSLEEYTKIEEDDVEGKYRACLLTGIAMRELGQHDQAAKMLAVAVGEKAPPEVRLQAMFEIIHNLTEQKKFDQVPAEVDRFRKAALAVLGDTPGNQLRVDVQAALLLDDMYEDQAATEKDPPRVKAVRGQAQKALLDFLQKYPNPDISGRFLDVVGWKYRDRQDRQNLSAIVLVALARIDLARHTEEGDAAALQFLDLASDANDPVSSQAAPYVLRESAALQYRMKRPREAGRSFFRLAGLTREANDAFPFALNSAVCFYNVYDEASKAHTVRADLQDEFLASLELLTGRWSDRPDTGPWYFVLGKLCAEKAQSYGPGSPQRAGLLQKAVEALEKTPASLPESSDARFRALEVRLRMLREAPQAAGAKAQATVLVARMKAFADDARKAQAAAQDKDQADLWADWGSRAAVGAIQVRYEFLGEQDASLRDLQTVLTEWPGSSVAREAMDWEIRTLVESAEIAKAIDRLDSFRKQYPQEAEGLIHLVVERIQERIRLVRQKPEAAAELERLRKAYIEFAKELYDRSAKGDPNQLYATRQMYADALWLSGDGEGSLKLWQECASENTARGEAKGKTVDAEIEMRTTLVTQARRNEADLRRCVQGYLKFLEEKKLADDSGRAHTVQEALRLMEMPFDASRAPEVDEHDRRMGAVVNKLLDGYKALGGSLKKQNQVDAMNLLGLARAHALLKHYREAMDFYGQLGKGIDRLSYGDFFWDVQLELCQTAREGFGGDKKRMSDLAQYVRQLKAEDSNMGGKAGLFNKIEFDATNASK